MSQLNSRHMFITNDRLHRVLFLSCRKTTATLFLPLCFSSSLCAVQDTLPVEAPFLLDAFQISSFLQRRKMWRGRLILTSPKQLYAQYNLMQISAMARSHEKKSAHPTFSPVTTKAFQDTYNIVRPHLYEETTFVKLSQRWRTFYIPRGEKKLYKKCLAYHFNSAECIHSALFTDNVKSDGPEVSGNLWVKPISQL